MTAAVQGIRSRAWEPRFGGSNPGVGAQLFLGGFGVKGRRNVHGEAKTGTQLGSEEVK